MKLFPLTSADVLMYLKYTRIML